MVLLSYDLIIYVLGNTYYLNCFMCEIMNYSLALLHFCMMLSLTLF